MRTGDTIAALATPAGASGRALLRLSGPGSHAVLAPHLEPERELRAHRVRRAVLRLPVASSQPAGSDDTSPRPERPLPVLIARFDAPRSYTGEHALEIQFAGQPALAQRVLSLALACGARLAEPGEFTARAYLNDRLRLDEAEGVQAVIAAESLAQLHAAQRLLSGQTGDRWRAHRDELATLLALVEAGIDFTDQEDVVAIAPRELGERLARVRSSLASDLGSARGDDADRDTPSVVLVGPPNAGKSTLFNALLRAADPRAGARAVESDTPGSTRDAIAERLELGRLVPGAGAILWTDLPGLDAGASTPAGAAAQRAACDALARAHAIVQCDPRGVFPPTLGAPPATPTVRVRTKADLPQVDAGGGSGRGSDDRSDAACAVCAIDGYGLAPLARAIADAASARPGSSVSPRAGRALRATRDAINEALAQTDPAQPSLPEPELVAGALREALDRLGELVGEVTPDDVLGRVFATFCVGK